jgi:hypothetical protein
MKNEFKTITNQHNPLHGKTYEEVCNTIKSAGYALRYVRNQTEEICKLAVQDDGEALQYVHNQTEEICKLAVQQNGDALKYVSDDFIHLF